MQTHDDSERGLIAWFARNPVAANLMMVSIILIGLFTAFTIRKQMFPQVEINWININAAYPGAAPQEVEETITVRLEEALASVQGIKRMITRSNRGSASANLEVMESYDAQDVLDDVKASIDSIPSFPDGMERLHISRAKYRQEVMYVSLSGNLPLPELKRLGEQLHKEMRALPGISIVDYHSGPNYEVAIEVSRERLYEYGLTLADVAQAVRSWSTNRSAGQVRTDDGIISVRVEDQAYVGAEFERLPVLIRADGTQVLLSDVAQVRDGFEEGIHRATLDGVNALTFFVGATREQSIGDVSDIIQNYIKDKQSSLPHGVNLGTWVDFTYYLDGRLNMMLSNMFWGGLLVFLVLALFLRMKLAMWVMMGLPVSFFGAIMLLPLSWVDVTINVASLFAFIMVLGVVVDDAIVIGESVHSEIEEKGQTLDNVIRGAKKVAMPATFGVLTTVAAFMPMVLESGPQAPFAHAIGFVVVFCLLFSLVESKLILPAHLAGMKPLPREPRGAIHKLQNRIDTQLQRLIQNWYLPVLAWGLHYRYTILALFTAVILVTAGMFAGGMVRFVGTPKIPHDFVDINIEMNTSASESATVNAVEQLEQMVQRVEAEIIAEYGQPMVAGIFVDVRNRTSASVQAKLVDPELRPIGTFELSARWREVMPRIAGVKNLHIRDNIFSGGTNDGDVSFRINATDEAQLKLAAAEVRQALEKLDGVYDVADSEQQHAQEVRFQLKPLAHSLGLTTADVAGQAAFSLYGAEAQRIVRDGEEIRVMVRYPENERNVLGAVDQLLITTPDGGRVPLVDLAHLELAEGVNQIYRENGRRTITVWASLDFNVTQPLTVANALKETTFAEITRRYPRVAIEESGSLQDERRNVMEQLRNLALILIPIYLLLALPLRSYAQPLMIMSVIPFGVIGAVWGHIILGIDLSQLSVFGIFAAIGVVVNDSLVMVDYINQARLRGESRLDAVMHGGQRRFRAIILTSLTTFIGLLPIITETSLQAKLVIPMAVSLAFGVLFATFVTLLLVPCLYLILQDVHHQMRKLKARILRLPAPTINPAE